MSDNLPEPQWSDAASFCVSCGYALDGMPAPWNCPECGMAYEARQLVLHGVPNRARSTSPLNRALWIFAIADAAVLGTIWPLILYTSGLLLLAMILALAAVVIWNLATNRRERGGVERFVITPTGIARMPLQASGDAANRGTVFLDFGGANDIDWKQVSPFWARLKVGTRLRGRSLHRVIFDAGVRCPQHIAPAVVAEIQARLRSRQHAAAPVVQ